MRLTNAMRDAFVRAVMADVPSTDYDDQIRKAVKQAYVEAMTPEAQALYKTRPDYFNTEWRRIGPSQSYQVPAPQYASVEIPSATVKQVTELCDLYSAQTEALESLKTRLHAVAYSVSTNKALLDALPEFSKYIPEDEAKASRSLPCVANVVADFVKAGWPTQKQGAPT